MTRSDIKRYFKLLDLARQGELSDDETDEMYALGQQVVAHNAESAAQ